MKKDYIDAYVSGLYVLNKNKKEIDNVMTFDKIKESITDFCKEMNEKYIGVNAVKFDYEIINGLVIYYNDNSNVNPTKRLTNIKIKKYEDNTVLIKGAIYFGDINEHSYKYDTVYTDLQTAYTELLDIFLKIETRIKKEINDNNKRELDKIMKEYWNQDVKASCELYAKACVDPKKDVEKETLLSTVYRYFYDHKNKMKEKDYIDAYISGISVKEDAACEASFYYKTGFYDVYCDYHHNICSIHVYTTDYKEIKIKGSIALNPKENMIIDISVNENNYKAMLYMLNEYIEGITTTIAGGGKVSCDVLIMDNERLLESFFESLMASIKYTIKCNYANSLAYKTEEICELSFDINDIADNAIKLTITNKNNGNKLTSVTISVDVQHNFTIGGWTLAGIHGCLTSKKINRKGTQEEIIGEIEYIFTSVEMYLKENNEKKINDMRKLTQLALNLKYGLINCCNGYFKNRLNVKIVSINPIGDFIVKVSGLNVILEGKSTNNTVAEITVESTQNEGIYSIKNDHLTGNGFGITKVICSNENRLPIIKDELKNSFNRIEEFLKYIKEEENKKNKDQYDAIVKSVGTIKYKLLNQLLDYYLSKSINFDIIESGKDNSVRFLVTSIFTDIPVAEVEITMNGLNNISVEGAFINKNKKIDTKNSIHCNNIDELRSKLDNIIVNVASTIGKIRVNIYNIEFRQIKDFVWNLNNMILKDEEFKIETIYHNYKDSLKIEFLINSENKNNFIVVEETRDYKFLIKYELFGLSSFKHFTKSDELNNYIKTLYEKIKHVVKSLS